MSSRATATCLALLGLAVAVSGPFGCAASSPWAADGERIAPLLEEIGTLHHPITSSDPMAQRFFDQGLTLVYGFNHREAIRSFQEAARLDPACAMCWWGQALALGPNINDPLTGAERDRQAYEAIEKARALAAGATERERAYIEALAVRSSAEAEPDRATLDAAYVAAMAELHARHPDDPDAAVLYASAIMDTMPWDYWTDEGAPRPGTETVLATLEAVIARHPDHAGANHYYIHAVEASRDPDRGVPSAERLGGLVPVAGHLVHMPSHIYIRVGRYADASAANRRAIAADQDYVTQCRAQGLYPVAYYPHNIHFLWAALSMEGRAEEAIRQAQLAASQHHGAHFEEPGFGFPHLLRALPLFAYVRFGRWDEALAQPEPEPELAFVRSVRHFARGMAFTARGRLDAAQAELDALRALAGEPQLAELKIFGTNDLASLLGIAGELLAGELAAQRGELDRAVAHLERGVALEDALTYSEPRDWPQPVRHSLGAVLLEAGRPAEAERVYRQDLEQHRDNGWALQGLAQSLEAQGRQQEAAAVRERFAVAWARADLELTGSRF